MVMYAGFFPESQLVENCSSSDIYIWQDEVFSFLGEKHLDEVFDRDENTWEISFRVANHDENTWQISFTLAFDWCKVDNCHKVH